MGNVADKIGDDIVVSLEYILRLADGTEVDRSDNGYPLQYLHGHGQVISGLEKALVGRKVGEMLKVEVTPDDGYGTYDADDVETLPNTAFPPDVEIELGMRIQLEDDTGEVFDAYVADILDDHIVLDLNHPLAGETLHFEVEIVGLRPATEDEIEHGHAHDDDDDHAD